MNLIEQLGGYERAKRIEKNIYGTGGRLIRYPSKDFDYNDDGGNVCDVELISFKANDLKKSLLEHRRENNIFEVGDKVVYKGEAGLNGLFEIERLTKTGKPKTVKTERFGNFPCRYCEVQHATDEEIKAGHRL